MIYYISGIQSGLVVKIEVRILPDERERGKSSDCDHVNLTLLARWSWLKVVGEGEVGTMLECLRVPKECE